MTASATGPPIMVATPRQVVRDDVVTAGGRRWRRVLLRTPWLTENDDLGAVLLGVLRALPGAPADGRDVVAVAEKVAVVTSDRAVPGGELHAGRLAHLLAGAVRPVGNSLGLSVPGKMQYVLDHAGRARVLTGVLAAALTRPFGRTGAFFRVVGPLARDVDGLRGAYEHALLPPLASGEAEVLAHHLAVRLRRAVAIVDINDRGGSVRAVSRGGPESEVLLAALADNPQGHCDQSTPVVLLRPLD